MKPVVQEEMTGCGIAAVAAAAGVTYRQAQKAANSLGIFAQDKALWSETYHVRRLSKHFGLSASSKQTPFRSWTSLPDLALLSVKWHLEEGKPFWHWVVFLRENGRAYVFDSKKALRHNQRTDFGRIKPKWSIGLRRSL
jgi:ABC-type bacteriocin/lantibiotic exporter with double-glycine peptidase domain